ncbi:FAD-dependent oxidoreductase [Xylophilus sp. Leaf220]|uniref:FAD-dependent oxidoreductase n=1 Tax=Xylophilus sp. Leaf220 TaxID=1735686 RepID=UPI0006F2CFFB|nr:FAD-dependent oxidoreductase [Xylophilus sp. Leaf220]KQM79578.1 fumarate reductase [Xylophilus sp. Leaf220]
MRRRELLQQAAAALGGGWALAGCEGRGPDGIPGGFAGTAVERGHLLRTLREVPAPAVVRRTGVLIAGGGIAGLAAARALRLRGQGDFALLELEDAAGGNSRGGSVGGIACPLGAHYLPVPGDDVPAVQDLLEELGLRRRVAGRWEVDERHLCHSPQERLFFRGEWQEGLLPLQDVGESTLAAYRGFARRVAALQRAARFAIPVQRSAFAPVQLALDAITFDTWLQQEQLADPHLRWYLDYCCRDDYGAGLARVSAWAGIHYFASRHGFHAPGEAEAERDPVLTWPEGNGFLARALAAPLGDRLRTGRTVLRIEDGRHGVTVDAWDHAAQQVERWEAAQCIVALPLHVAVRVVAQPPDLLRTAAAATPHAPWLVANLHLDAPLHDRPGPAPAWDNVVYQEAAAADAAGFGRGLGYVDARHQTLDPTPGPTVLTCYLALGDLAGGRAALLDRPWQAWRDAVLAELAAPHPDIAERATRIKITRYGHAMAVPVPGTLQRIGLQPARNAGHTLSKKEHDGPAHGRLRFAHSDWSGYSVFEEAFSRGHAAGSA